MSQRPVNIKLPTVCWERDIYTHYAGNCYTRFTVDAIPMFQPIDVRVAISPADPKHIQSTTKRKYKTHE